jgi:hypothetical protein
MRADFIYPPVDGLQLFLSLRIQNKRLLSSLPVKAKLSHGINTLFTQLQKIMSQLHSGSFSTTAALLNLTYHQDLPPFTGYIHHIVTDNDPPMLPGVTLTAYAASYSKAIIKLIHRKTAAGKPGLARTDAEALHQMAAKAIFFRICRARFFQSLNPPSLNFSVLW